MKKKKITGMFAGMLWGLLTLGACSFLGKTIYEDDQISAVVQNDGEDTILAVTVGLPSEAPSLSKTSMDLLTEDGPKREYEVQLSDGMIYGYQDATSDHGTETYVKVLESMREVNEVLDRSLLQSNENAYQPGENNFLLLYDKIQGDLTIQAAEVTDMEKLKVTWNVYMTLKSSRNNRATSQIYDVTNQVQHESYLSPSGIQTELFWDTDMGKAGIYALEEGVCYIWELDGEVDEETVKAFADTIMHKS